jgi:hypothetical protein
VYIVRVGVLKAQVRNGRLVMDEPTELPEGTVLELVPADLGDDLDEAERTALNQAIDASWAEMRAGKVIPAEEVIARLAARK